MTNQTTLELIGHAASQNDRWLMVAMLVTILGCSFFAVRWLAGALEKLENKGAIERKELMDSYASERKERFELMRIQADKITNVIQDNTAAFARNCDVLDRVVTKLDKA